MQLFNITKDIKLSSIDMIAKSIDCEYSTSTNYEGKLIVSHFDQTKWIISGTFEFEAYSNDCQATVKVTDGRFDLNYAL